jgi:hypothetical protein
MITLRGHHLICLHFFNGEGYNEIFVKNLNDVLQRMRHEEIEVLSGADDVCKACPHLKDNECQYNKEADEEVREMDGVAKELLEIRSDQKVRWQEIKEKVVRIFPKWFEAYCIECDWKDVCKKSDFYQQLIKG